MSSHRLVRLAIAIAICSPFAAAAPAAAFGDAVFGPVTVEGNPFDFAVLDASWEHLEDLGWFAFVDLDYDDGEDGVVPVTVIVEEDQTTRWYPVIDYDPRWDVLLGARIYDINFRGRGETFSARGTWYARHGYELDWDHPWLFGADGLSCGLGLLWEAADFEFLDFDFNRWAAGGWLRWEFTRPFFAEAGLTLHGFEQETGTAGTHFATGAERRNRAVWRGTLGVDTRDLTHYPTRGVYARTTAEIVDRPSHHDTYTLLTGDLRGYVPLPWEHVLALRAWGRRVDGALWPEDMLFWGGADTIRGHDYASLAGEEGFLLSVEYRWPLFLMPISGDGRVIGIGLHAFGDAGSNWWDEGDRGTLYSWGGGAHINISDHQFRFELAIPAEGDVTFQFMDAFNF